MDVRTKPPAPASRTRDNFLADAIHPQSRGLTVADGFKLGIGFITAQLIVALIVGGLAWALVVAFKLHS